MPGSVLSQQYALHLRAAEARVRGLLREHGLEPLFGGIHPCPIERGYRTQASFRAGRDGSGPPYVGVDPRTGRVPLDDALWVMPEPARPAAVAVRDMIVDANLADVVSGFDLRLEHGTLRAHVGLAAPREGSPRLDDVCARLMDEVPGLHGVSVASQGIELGETHLRNIVCDRTVLAHYLAFFQTNAHVTPALAAEAQAHATGARTVVDLYCGVGMHSILAAGPKTEVHGADNNRWAIESAERNVALHGLRTAAYHRETAERFAATHAFDAPDVVFVNPSRFGCGAGVPAAVARWRPAAVCLVSCSVPSHVRDTLAFIAAGYRPQAVRCFDMFPFSEYLESVTHFAAG
ncbi:MAG: rRNA (uracil-5-)-methyltransferase RumA [Gemmatimonadetes bacterium]|nr:rRNA (uracil-5-)-methyltransferase RumA [Gemmatimonadota bacterium]